MSSSHPDLQGARILILEDDYYLATDLQAALERSGAYIIGPFADAADAARAIEHDQPDCAFVDVNLGQGPSFDLPRTLARENIPFAFVTGYNADTIPSEFEASVRLEKPVELGAFARVARHLLAKAARPA